MIIDTHAHLDFPEYESDIETVLNDAKIAGVEAIVNVGVSLESSKKGVALADRPGAGHALPEIFVSIGIHPNEASNVSDLMFDELRGLARLKKVIAIGETGLDYYRDYSSREDQKRIFRRHIELAIEANLPLIIHNREASDDCLNIIGDYSQLNRKGVVHCFSGSKEYVKRFLDTGFYISFTGVVTFPRANGLRDTIRYVPTDRLLLETDCPFLAPQPKRGARNEPSYLKYIIPLLAQIYNLSYDDVARVTTFNAQRLFGIGKMDTKGEIAYIIRNSLYLNITNKCTNRCNFCTRETFPYVKGHYLKLSKEPSVEELIKAIGDPSIYDEVVFCGYGEPTERLDVLKTVARYLKAKGARRIRLDTNGLGVLINGRPICEDLKGLIDKICISLNTDNKDQYERICRPDFGDKSYPALLSFIKEAKRVIPDVMVSVVSIHEVDIDKCRKMAEELGVSFRIRKYNDTG